MSGNCPASHVVHTVGHSTRGWHEFLALLRAHSVEVVVDVRRWPTSRRSPHFCKDHLETALAAEGIRSVWRENLGGYRTPSPGSPNTGWRVGAFRAYADFMLTPEFHHIVAELEAMASNARLALLCAEASPWRCHRQLLADAFLVRGWNVRHIVDRGCTAHRLTPFAQVQGLRILYPSQEPRNG